jgi:hypothetical protein
LSSKVCLYLFPGHSQIHKVSFPRLIHSFKLSLDSNPTSPISSNFQLPQIHLWST